MSNEIQVTVSLSFTKGGTSVTWPPPGVCPISVSMAANAWLLNRQTVGTAEEALQLGDAGTGGLIAIWNKDATNYVQYKAATGVTAGQRIKAGNVALFQIDAGAAAPFVQANTASVDIEYLLLAP